MTLNRTPFGKALLCALTFLPPLSFAVLVPGGFMLALSYAGVFASILLVVYPASMAWCRRYIRRQPGGYRVAGGKVALLMAILFGLAVILLDVANQVGLLPMPAVP